MANLQIYEYKGTPIEFEVIEGQVFANATEMCQAFGKRPVKWLELESTKRYIEAIKAKSEKRTLVETRQGGTNAGTWIHEKLIIKLAQWLDVDFEIWCDEKVAQIISTGTVTKPMVELSTMQILEIAMQSEQQRMALENQNRQLMQKNEVLSEKAEYVDKVLSSESGHATTIIAKELGMSAVTLNKLLEGLGVQYMTKAGEWVLKAAHQNKGYVESRTHAYLSSDKFTTKTKIYFVWTELGRKFIHELVTRKLGGINSTMS